MDSKWWFKSFGQEFGPLAFVDLAKAARNGTLAPSELVRYSDRNWRRADSVKGLFTDAPSGRAEWLVEVVGQTIGPLSIADVADMIRQRKLLSSDCIRRADSFEWQPIGTILDGLKAPKHDSNAGVAVPAADDLESFILSVLGAPSDIREKPSLAELGLAHNGPANMEQEVAFGCDYQTAAIATMRQPKELAGSVRRSPLDVFRRALSPLKLRQEQVASSADELSNVAATPQVLPPIERQFATPSFETKVVTSDSHRVPWLECLLLIGGIALIMQLFPAMGSRAFNALDVRRWTWGNLVAVEVASILILAGLVIRHRR
jgi:hypothetical protein